MTPVSANQGRIIAISLAVACLALPLHSASAASTPPDSQTACSDRRMQVAEKKLDLAALMKKSGIPGLSVAVIQGYKIVCAKGYGVTAKGGGAPVTPATLFMAGSISKPVTAVGALVLVQQGEISLDKDVNAKLSTWTVPDNDYTQKHKVTLGLLLDHTGGFTGGDFFPGYAVGADVPALQQILDGESPATNDPMRVGYVPGSEWRYSGDGYLVIQQLLIDVSGESFPDFMRAAVFAKLGMHDTTFEEPLPANRATQAAAGTLKDGSAVAGGWHVTPEMAAGGLWSTPTDLAKLAIELALSEKGKANHVLSQATTQAMLSPHWNKGVVNLYGPKGDPDGMGYGFFVGKERGRFGHIGGNVGYQATLLMFGDTGDGVVIMTNSDIGLNAGNPFLDKIAEAFGWDYVAPPLPF